jgi:hypothetical protein
MVVFWAIRLILLAQVFPALLFNWRQAVVISYALLVDFITLLGLILPGFGIWNEFLLVFPASILIGIVLSLGRNPSRAPLFVCVLTLLVLRASLYADGLFGGNTQVAIVLHSLLEVGVLVLAVGLGIEAPFQVRRLLLARLRARTREDLRPFLGVDPTWLERQEASARRVCLFGRGLAPTEVPQRRRGSGLDPKKHPKEADGS